MKRYHRHDREIWQRIFHAAPADWLDAPPSHAMELCLEHLRRRRPRHVLDLACGFGRWGMYLRRKGIGRITGIDSSFPGIRLGRDWAAREGVAGLRFTTGDALHLPFSAGAFEAVVAALLLDNLDRQDARRAVAEVTRTCRPEATGFFVFNPRFTPEQLADLATQDNPTRGCMHVVYEDEELPELLAGWKVTNRRESREGFRIVEGLRR